METERQAIDALLDKFVAKLTELGGPKRVQFVPEFEPDTIAFWAEYPDRLIAGRSAFDGLRARGYAEVT